MYSEFLMFAYYNLISVLHNVHYLPFTLFSSKYALVMLKY